MRIRVPVFSGPRCIELADEARVRQLSKAPNAELIRKRKTKQIVQINLKEFSNDSTLVIHRGNPRRYSHDHETPSNPPRCWTLRRLPDETGPIYRAVVTSCLKEL